MNDNETLRVLLIGVGATALMDAWGLLQRCVRLPVPDYALVGRWVAGWRKGIWAHGAIAKSPSVRGERALGWLVHYATGIAFAGLLVGLFGADWMRAPSLCPALLVGIATVVAPWLLMQPAFGLGIAASHTATPWKNRLKSLANHTVFGVGLYLAATLLAALPQ